MAPIAATEKADCLFISDEFEMAFEEATDAVEFAEETTELAEEIIVVAFDAAIA